MRPLPRRRNSLSADVAPAPQLNCDLLSRLPLELREEIYGYVLGGTVIHLVQIPRRIVHSRCRLPHPSDGLRSCRPAIQTPLDPCLGSVASANVALLKTCRQIYCEASKILYAVNTFDVNRLSTFISFTETIIPARLAAITRLHVSWEIGSRHSPSTHTYLELGFHGWVRCWHIIAAQMPGLQHLKVHLKTVQEPSVYLDWVAPMCEVSGLRSVDISLDYLVGEEKNAKILKRHLVAMMTRKQA